MEYFVSTLTIFGTGTPSPPRGGNRVTVFDEWKDYLKGRSKPTGGPLANIWTILYKLFYTKMKFVILDYFMMTKVVLEKSARPIRRMLSAQTGQSKKSIAIPVTGLGGL
jgi:hypothetical protein